MSQPSRFRVLVREVRRRSVWQVLGVYVAASWAVLQVVDQLVERLSLPEWTYGFALLLLLVGLPVVLATAVVQEGAPGQRREDGTARAPTLDADVHSALPPSRTASRWLTWRNAGAGGVVALALWGLLAAGWLAVLPFAVRGSGDYAYLREGLVDLLSTRLDGVGELRTVDSHALLSALGPGSPVDLAPAAARELAERFGAALVVLGNAVEVEGRLRLSATVYDFARGAELEVAAAGEAAAVFELVDSVAAQILGGLAHGPGARVGRIAALTTSSLPALRAYFSGDAAFREGRFEEAYDAFTLATEEDSLFALAHYRRSMAAEWTTRLDGAITSAEAALRHSARLSDRDRRQLEAFLAYRRGAFHEAERLYRTIVGRYPDDVEAWHHLGETLFHYAPLHGRSLQSAREPFERVLSYDTFRGAAIVHLARVAAAAGRAEALDSLVAMFMETNPEGDRELELLALQAWVRDDAPGQAEVLRRIAAADYQIAAFVVWDLANYVRSPEGAMAVAAALTGDGRPPEVRIWGHSVRAYALVGLGRWREAREELDRAAAVDAGVALEHRALLTLFPPLRASRDELIVIRDGLRRIQPAAIPVSRNPTGFFNVQDGIHDIVVQYLLGLTQARLGEGRDAARIADWLEAKPSPTGMGSLTADFAWTVRAEMHRQAGRSAEALAALDRVRMEGWYSQMLGSPFLARTHGRFLRAELLLEMGRADEAVDLYASLPDANPHEVMYLGISHLRQARILAGLGRVPEARAHRARVETLWSEADPELRALLGDV